MIYRTPLAACLISFCSIACGSRSDLTGGSSSGPGKAPDQQSPVPQQESAPNSDPEADCHSAVRYVDRLDNAEAIFSKDRRIITADSSTGTLRVVVDDEPFGAPRSTEVAIGTGPFRSPIRFASQPGGGAPFLMALTAETPAEAITVTLSADDQELSKHAALTPWAPSAEPQLSGATVTPSGQPVALIQARYGDVRSPWLMARLEDSGDFVFTDLNRIVPPIDVPIPVPDTLASDANGRLYILGYSSLVVWNESDGPFPVLAGEAIGCESCRGFTATPSGAVYTIGDELLSSFHGGGGVALAIVRHEGQGVVATTEFEEDRTLLKALTNGENLVVITVTRSASTFLVEELAPDLSLIRCAHLSRGRGDEVRDASIAPNGRIDVLVDRGAGAVSIAMVAPL